RCRPDARRVRGALDDDEAPDRGALEGGTAARLDRPGAPVQLPAPALGRDAAAGDDRDGAAVHARANRDGRADLRARRRRPALADGADQGAPGAARLRGRLRHARHVARAALLRPAARDVRGAGRGAWADAAGVREAAAPVHERPARGVPVDPRAEGAPDRDPGRAAGPAPPAGRLPLRAALPARVRPLPRGGAAAVPGRRRARTLLPPRARGGRAAREGRRRVSEPLLRTENLTRHFRVGKLLASQTLHAVDDVSFEVGSGEIVALVGESGS